MKRRKTKNSQAQQYDEMGEQYIQNQRSFFSGRHDWTREKIQGELRDKSGVKLLDIGCGSGDDIRWCEENEIEAYGIDSSEKMLQLAKGTVSHPERIRFGHYESIPFDAGVFDIVMGRFSLHYLRDFSNAYKEMARVLKPNGYLLQIVSHPVYDALKIVETGDEDRISVTLYDGEVIVEFPPHSITDHFSPTFFDLFQLLELDETESVDAENPHKVPETLFYKAMKRNNNLY